MKFLHFGSRPHLIEQGVYMTTPLPETHVYIGVLREEDRRSLPRGVPEFFVLPNADGNIVLTGTPFRSGQRLFFLRPNSRPAGLDNVASFF